MRFPDETVKILWFDTYLAMIHNSVGMKTVRNVFAIEKGKRVDILRSGDLSCAIYVTTILTICRLIDRSRTTVTSTIAAMKKHGWKSISQPRPGAILVWEQKKFSSGESHRHIGFYVGKNKAISNDPKGGFPIEHHWTFGIKKGKPARRVEMILWNKALEK